MKKDKIDEAAKLLTSTISFTCPDGIPVGATFKVCGEYNPTLKCPYRVRCRVYYLNAQNVATEIEHLIIPHENPNKWSCQFALTSLPAQGEDLLISARLFNKANQPLSPLRTTSASYDAGTTADACGAACTGF